MIAYLKGEVLDVAEDSLVLLCGGVGYLVYVPLNRLSALPAPGEELALYTYLQVNNQPGAQGLSLFGFAEKRELQLFNLLTGVSSIGAKTAMAALNSIGYAELVGAVQAGNLQTLTRIPGVGKKSAERILLELKDKIMKLEPQYAPAAEPAPVNDLSGNLRRTAALALSQLGYSQGEAAGYVEAVCNNLPQDAALEDIITAALQFAARS